MYRDRSRDVVHHMIRILLYVEERQRASHIERQRDRKTQRGTETETQLRDRESGSRYIASSVVDCRLEAEKRLIGNRNRNSSAVYHGPHASSVPATPFGSAGSAEPPSSSLSWVFDRVRQFQAFHVQAFGLKSEQGNLASRWEWETVRDASSTCCSYLT